jgi:2-polyprenyl-3-methyl-5-hydroxy-6-metoxy-1,4-benzoquinol methylase
MQPTSEGVLSPAEQFDRIAFLYDDIMTGVPYDEWLAHVQRILAKYSYTPQTVLDLCCGTGTFSRLLAENGYEVSGSDISAEMIRIAKERSARAGLDIDFRVQDAARLRLGKKFDLVVSLFDSLNYILEASSLQQAFHGVAQHLNPGGMFIFDMNTELAFLAGLFDQNNLLNKHARVRYNWRSSYDKAARICRVQMDFTYKSANADEMVEVVHYQRAYDQTEITDMLATAGLTTRAVYNAYTLRRPTKHSDRVFYVATREK